MPIEQNIPNEQGSILVVTVLILVLLSIMGTASLSLTNIELLVARNERLNSKAFFLAEGAVNQAVYKIQKLGINQQWIKENYQVNDTVLSNDSFWSSLAEVQNASLSGARYFASRNTTDGQIECYGRGAVHDAEKVIIVGMSTEMYTGYALLSNGGLELKDNTITKGDIFSNGDMELKEGATVDGDLESNGTITTNSSYNGTVEYSPQKTISDLDWNYMNSTAHNHITGTKTFYGTESESGIYFVDGDVNFVENAMFSNNISIIATGTIITNSGLDMQCVDGYPALASMSDIEVNGGDSESSTNIKGLIHARNKIEVKGESDINIYGSIVTNATEGSALELKDDTGILTVEYDDQYLRNNKYHQDSWREL